MSGLRADVGPAPVSALRLESLAYGGDAVGRVAGKTTFVPFGGAPGDRVEVRRVSAQARYDRAEVLRLLEPGPHRAEPLCPLFGSCGGCQWQQVDIAEQQRQKEQILRHRFSRHLAPQRWEPFCPSPAAFGYRRRARLHWTVQDGACRLGFRRHRAHDIVDVATCPLLKPALNAALVSCRAALQGLPSGAAGTAVLLGGGAGEVHLSLRIGRGGALSRQAMTVLQQAPLVGACVQGPEGREVVGAAAVNLAAPTAPALWASAEVFAQAHGEQEEALRAFVANALAGADLRILELFCGVGSLTQALVAARAEVTAVEVSAAALALLQKNAASWGGPVRCVAEPATDVVRRLAARGERYDVVVLDPPREGSLATTRALVALAPQTVIYVSCDPMTLARDLQPLLTSGYLLARLGAWDMMPQTYHLETVAVLTAPGRR